MRILVTGGAGFIGSHVAAAYLRAGHAVTVLDNLSHGRRGAVPSGARFVKADVRGPGLASIFARGRFDVVNHHAAQIDVRRSVADPLEDADINLRGLLQLLENSRARRVRKFIFAASGGTYYGECARPARESDPPRPLSPYGVSKLSSEFYLRAYRALHGLDFTVLRYANVYGPGQDPHGEAGVVAIFCQRLSAGKPVTVFGSGRQERDYVFVGDVAEANRRALTRGSGGFFNIGSGRATSVQELFRVLRDVAGRSSPVVRRPARPGELKRSCLDFGLATRVLGWRPGVSLREGLAETWRRHLSMEERFRP